MRVDLVLSVVACIGLSSFANMAHAEQQEIILKLNALTAVQPQESGGDELYFSVTEYPAKGSPKHYQVPSFPSHWLSKYLPNVKDIVLWKSSSSQCESADLLITLVEEDLAPWNIDDALGSVSLKVECINGKAVETWSVPDDKTASKIPSKQGAFTFDGQGAKYQAQFSIQINKTTKP